MDESVLCYVFHEILSLYPSIVYEHIYGSVVGFDAFDKTIELIWVSEVQGVGGAAKFMGQCIDVFR